MLGFLQYTVEAGVVFAVLVLIYRHVYYGISYNKWERGYLLASTVLSYLLPLLKVGHEIRPAPRAEDRVIELLDKTDDWQMVVVSRLHDSESIVSKITHSTLFDTCITVLFAVYVAGAAVKLVTFVRGLMKTSSLKGRGAVKVQSIEGVDVYKTDLETVAFSFFRNIFIGKKSAGLNPDELDIIIRHEMQHVVFGLYSVLQWFNPMSRIAARYSRVVCENIADTGAVGDGGLTEYSRLVLRLGLTNIAKVSAPRPKRRSALVDRIAQLLSGDGEKINGSLWTSTAEGDNAWHFLNSGKATVEVRGGKVGYVNEADPSKSIKGNLPYGNVFGGSAGEAAPNIAENPRYLYCPTFFSGYVNETEVKIGLSESEFEALKAYEPYKSYGTYETYKTTGAPQILGSVYGGGQDGHVRRDTKVTVNNGEIGLAYNDTNRELLKTTGKPLDQELNDPQWLFRGNVYGAGSGITKYKYNFNYDEDTIDTHIAYGTDPITGATVYVNEEDYSNSAGSVTRFTEVNINGGTIHRNVYGGGSMSSVGPPNMGQTYEPYKKDDPTDGHTPGRQSQCTVNIAGTIGTLENYQKHYGGEVYGASRGLTELKDKEDFSYTIWTVVNLLNGANVKGNVYGGGDAGIVKRDTEVNVGPTVAP